MPVSGATVKLYSASGARALDTTVTDAAGQYAFCLASGRYIVRPIAPGYERGQAEPVQVAAGQTTRHDFELSEIPAVSDLSIARSGSSAVLNWTMPIEEDVAGFELWRGVTPYFTPGALYSRVIANANSSTCVAAGNTISCTDAGVIGDPTVNRFYLVRIVGSGGGYSLPSAHVGEADYAFAQDGVVTMPLGGVTVVTQPTPCSGQQCWGIQVQCPQLIDPIGATVKVGESTTGTTQGTIVFFTGWVGTSYLDEWGTEAQRMLSDLRAAGYRIVQVKWGATWFSAASGEAAGFQRLACRAATVTQWVTQTWGQAQPELPFCVYGHSNGATEVALMLTRYGIDAYLAAAMMNSGPNYAQLDAACIQDDPQYSALWYPESERSLVDWSFGYPNNAGPCYFQNVSRRAELIAASASLGQWQYVYPQTNISFVFSELDQSFTRAHGEYHYQTLASAQTPLLQRTVVPGAPHSTFTIPSGADAVRDALIAACQLPPKQ